MNTPLPIQEFMRLAKEYRVLDVRSPGEFEQGHIPGAYNVPLFDNEERAKVGTAYVQQGKEEAIKLGYELANPKIKSFLGQVQVIAKPLNLPPPIPTVLIHCWRGGLRSSKFAQLLNAHGYNTHTLIRGYKAYRNFVLSGFTPDSFRNAELLIIGGETGSGKTGILNQMAALGEQVIDLEAIAHHKGSAFGSLGEKSQPTHEQFENNLFFAFSHLDLSRRIWLEDESRNIGKTQLPLALWDKMKLSPIFRVVVPKKIRIERLVAEYGAFSKEELTTCILKIRQRLGPQHVKSALEELEKGNLHAVADFLLTYYDKAYNYQHEKRNMENVFFIGCDSANAFENTNKIIRSILLKTNK